MKYLAIWEYDPNDIDAVKVKWMEFGEARKKKPELFPKSLSKAYAMFDGYQGFQLYEANNDLQLSGMVAYYAPELEFRFIPIAEATEAIGALDKVKK